MTARVLVLDHRDSFVFTLVDHFARLGAEVRILRTSVSLPQLQSYVTDFAPDLLLLSPGPGHPEHAGVMVPFLRTMPSLPILGICLGHQALALAAGGDVARTAQPVHGRASEVRHDGDPIFDGLPNRFAAGRYHSLSVTNVPAEFEVIARAADDPQLVMAIRHRSLPQIGLQFHPESVLTPFGARLIRNILQDTTTTSIR